MLMGISSAAEQDGLTVLHVDLPGWAGDGVLWPRGSRWYILVRAGLPRVEAAAVVAHELAHWRRGVLPHHRMPDTWEPIAAREESACNRQAAAMLIPPDELGRFADELADAGQGISPYEVMAEFEVTWQVACDALDNLTRWERP